MKSKTNLILIIFCHIIGLFFTWIILGINNLNPVNLNWISSHDLKSDYLAFKFFINDKWRFPIGLNPNYGEITNSIVFSGAVQYSHLLSKLLNFITSTIFLFG